MEAAKHRTVRRRVVWLTGLALAATLASAIPPQVEPAAAFGGNCSNSSVGYTPLSESGDLYAAGNTMPSSHAAAAPDITPQGGVIGVVSLGMSNAAQEWEAFMSLAEASPAVASSLRFGNGSIGGQTMAQWAEPNARAWTDAVQRIQGDGLNANQVRVVWMKMGSKLEQLPATQGERVEQERAWLDAVIANAAGVFPNLERIYISSRIYAGYAVTPSHSEPQTGYDNGLSVRALVADAVAGETAVWTAWGPYLWADGVRARSDGLAWECNDFEADGVHPDGAGETKVAEQLFDFFSSEPTACEWFLADSSKCGSIPGGGGSDPRFEDVPTTHTFYEDIEWLAANEITLGCNPPSNSLFCPNDTVTRGQMAAFLDRALGLPAGPDVFIDDDGSVFEASINAIAAAGITLGCNPPANSRFCPNDRVTRGEMAAFLDRALGLPAGPDVFIDDDGSVFEASINAIAAAGVTLGCNPPINSRYCPTESVTRAQMAAFLHRAEVFFG